MKLVLKLLAPYFAVILFWCVIGDAWLAILVYHAQILAWSWRSVPRVCKSWSGKSMVPALVTVFAGPLLYFFLPYIVRTEVSSWLADYQLTRVRFMVMIPYFGFVHPFLEQVHWLPLRGETPFAHFMFAGYHMIVLYSLISLPWLAACFVVLVGASVVWHNVTRKDGGLTGPIVSHVLADTGVILAAWLRI